jgi:hypothetical protein
VKEGTLLRWKVVTITEVLPPHVTKYDPSHEDWLNYSNPAGSTHQRRKPGPKPGPKPARHLQQPGPHPCSPTDTYVQTYVTSVFPPLIRKYFATNGNLLPVHQPEGPLDVVHALWAAIVASTSPHLREHLPSHPSPPPLAEEMSARLVSSIRAALPRISTLGEDLILHDHITLYHDLTAVLQPCYPLVDDAVALDLVYTRKCNHCDDEHRTSARKTHIHLTIDEQYDGEDSQQLLAHDPLRDLPTCQACGKHTTRIVSTDYRSPPPPSVFITLTRPQSGVAIDVLQQVQLYNLQYQLKSILRATPTGWVSQYLDPAASNDTWLQQSGSASAPLPGGPATSAQVGINLMLYELVPPFAPMETECPAQPGTPDFPTQTPDLPPPSTTPAAYHQLFTGMKTIRKLSS